MYLKITIVLCILLTTSCIVSSTQRFVIDHPGCTIPNYSTFPENFRLTNVPVPNFTKPLVRQIHNFRFLVNDPEEANCCYRQLNLVNRTMKPSASNDYELMEQSDCVPVRQSVITIYGQRVTFECRDKKYYVFFNIPLEKVRGKIDYACRNTTARSKKLNVLILGIDSTSRLNMHRFMPKTVRYLKKLNAVEFLGYNVLGDSSFPNLYGVVIENQTRTEWKEIKCVKRNLFDSCPMIWDRFNEANYITAFAEDSTYAGLFTFGKPFGFKDSRLDYDYRLWDKLNTKNPLMRNRQVFRLLRLFTIDAFRDVPYFFYSWATSYAHDKWDGGIDADDEYFQLLRDLDTNDVLNKTLLVFMADHGYRGKTRRVPSGFPERHLPGLYIRVPTWFQEEYPRAFENFQLNHDKLMTTRDIQATVLNVLTLDTGHAGGTTSRDEVRTSLFEPIARSRTCNKAQIPSQYCACIKEITHRHKYSKFLEGAIKK